MIFHTRRRNFQSISDSITEWDPIKKQCLLSLDIIEHGAKVTIELPCVHTYKYLEIQINRTIIIIDHMKYLQ